jgi:hypothetical protein
VSLRTRTALALAVLCAVASGAAAQQSRAAASGAAPTETELRAEAARVPAHAQTWVYYGVNEINYRVPAEIMARYATFIEDGDHGIFAARFKAAGGRYTAAYVDPMYIPYCDPPFVPPAGRCGSEYSRYIKDESGWFHGPDGARVHRYVAGDHKYYEAVNPASPAARRAWREFTAVVKQRAPAIDFLYSDDSGGPLRFGDMSPTSSLFWDFNAGGVEIQSDEVFRDTWIAFLADSALPLIINGGDPYNLPAYGGAFVRQPFVRGNSHEGCFRYSGGVKTLKSGSLTGSWTNESDALLSNTGMHRWGLCFMTGAATLASRLYAVASWWVTYDPDWSVAAPIDVAPVSLLPEFSIVPRFPTRTAVSHVAELRTATGAYVREFAGCYQNRVFIGGCATVVNPTSNTVAIPPLTGTYHRSLELRGADVTTDGVAIWNPGRPNVLGPGSAAVLVR